MSEPLHVEVSALASGQIREAEAWWRANRTKAPNAIALGKVIRAMGVKEFAGKVRMASPNVLRAIHPRHNPTQVTLNRLLKPFTLKLSLARLDEPKGRQAA